MHLQRAQQDVIAPGIWLTFIASVAFFAREHLLPAGLIGTLVLGIYYAARDAAGDPSHE